MMAAVLLLSLPVTVLGTVPGAMPGAVSGAEPCAGVYDRSIAHTPQCEAPLQLKSTIRDDVKALPPAPARSPWSTVLAVSIMSGTTLVVGAAAIAATQLGALDAAGVSAADQTIAAPIGLFGGVALVAASAALLSSTLALVLFDPSTGTMRVHVDGE